MPTLSQVKAGAAAAGWGSSSSSSSLSGATQNYLSKINFAGKNTINPIPSSGITLRPFQESNFIGFTGFGSDTKKQFSIGNEVNPDFKSGTRFISETEAKSIGAITDQGKSVISGKGIFTAFSDLFRNTTNVNLVNLGKAQIDQSAALAEQAEQTTLGFEGISSFVTDVQNQLGAADKRLSEQVIQIGKDTTQLGKDNGDGGAFWDNLAAGLGIGLPVLAIGGIAAAVLLLRK